VKTALVWFRNDLRLDDNPAFFSACAAADRIVPVFILDDAAAGDWKPGGASRWWLHHSLASLARDLRARGADLILRQGNAETIIPELAAEAGGTEIHAARSFEPWARGLDIRVATALRPTGIAFHRHLSAQLFAPESIKTKTGGPYTVYTPFSRACLERDVSSPQPAPARIAGIPGISSIPLNDLNLLPKTPDWAGGLRDAWRPGEAGAKTLLDRFLAGPVQKYDECRNLPGIQGTSRLSPHVHFGEISPRRLWHAARAAPPGKGAETFIKELLWREFSISLLWHNLELPELPIRAEFANFPWAQNPAALRAWQEQKTGYPIVDAGMRELWQTGWMHNRVRMITASFLVKHLLIPWQDGEKWFWDCLVDADLAANAASWQWVAGCGADAAPYFRIFNPVLQGRKFDPEGNYVRRFVPELAGLPDEFIHTPWEAPESVLAAASITPGITYPPQIIDLTTGRERALAAYKTITDQKNA
jgi:deoxyribodipyrimidine photo-lyase